MRAPLPCPCLHLPQDQGHGKRHWAQVSLQGGAGQTGAESCPLHCHQETHPWGRVCLLVCPGPFGAREGSILMCLPLSGSVLGLWPLVVCKTREGCLPLGPLLSTV